VKHIRKAFAAAGMAAVIAAGSAMSASAALDDWWPMQGLPVINGSGEGIRFPAQETRVSVWSIIRQRLIY